MKPCINDKCACGLWVDDPGDLNCLIKRIPDMEKCKQYQCDVDLNTMIRKYAFQNSDVDGLLVDILKEIEIQIIALKSV